MPLPGLTQGLAAEDAISRISRGEFSQPLCTAIQIALVDLLRVAGIQFNALIGHSSGGLGVAYAAGNLSTKDAMGTAYYRGFVAYPAKGAKNQEGGMIAIGIAFDAATAFYSQPGSMAASS